MLFVVRFTDKTTMRHVRADYMAAHIDWLAARQAQIKVAGSLRHDANDYPIGALWIIEAKDRAEVENLWRTDPFWLHGMRESVEILHWSKAFPEAMVAI
ncbi:YciI family protein [Undibacterium sp. TC9W]|uniref:YciI family protein n=1 Tax=Undibacterium sp. TC9W TaxID=3413053 RepID=UPI003BEF4E3D